MINFEFYTPTKVFFGKDTQAQVGEIVKRYGYKKILLHFGGGSIIKTGLLDQVKESLTAAGIDFVLLGGVSPNPTLSLAKRGIQICIEEGIEMVLAVGGGSVIDSAKCIADGAANPDKDVWSFWLKKDIPQKALPVAVILTLSASGSEMSSSAVISNEEGSLKRGLNAETHRPLFAILNPELTYTVNRFQTGCGTVDIMMHTLERYFTKSHHVDLTDRLAEGLLKAVIEAGRVADQNPEDYEARATLMWAGSLSHNDLTGAGRDVFMSVHQMEHELSGKYPKIAHGAGLSALFCSWARYVCPHNVERFVQYATRVWNCELNYDNLMETALDGIAATEGYFRYLGMPTNLKALGITDEAFGEMAEKCTFYGARTLPDYIELGKTEIEEIFRMAYEA